MKSGYLYLIVAILFEIAGTSALKYTQEFTRLWPSLLVAACYVATIYLLALSIREINIGVAYAIWSGVGIVGIALIQVFWFREALDLPAIGGVSLILAGVVVINLFSQTVTH